MSVWKGMVLFEDPKLFGRPTLLDTDASIVAVEKVHAELLSTCLSDLSDPIILRSVPEEATSGGCRSPIRLEFSWPYGYVKLAHHIRKKLAPSATSYLAADTSGGGRLLTLVVELPEEMGDEELVCVGWIRSETEEGQEDVPIPEVGAGLEGHAESAPQSPESTESLDCNMNESQQKLFDGMNVDEPAEPSQPTKATEPPHRDLEPFFSTEEAKTLDAKESFTSLDQDECSKKTMGWKKISRFFIAPDSKPELELQEMVVRSRGNGSVQVDFRQVGFGPRKVRLLAQCTSMRIAGILCQSCFQAFLVIVGLGDNVANGVCLSNAVNHVLDALLTDSEDETTECYYVASSKLRR